MGLILLLAALAPLAAGDHSYAHQLVVEGRVVDVNGDPVAGTAVSVTISGVAVGAACILGDKGPTTNDTGDFRICRHTHELGEGVTANVSVLDAAATVPVDPALRRAALLLRIGNETPVHSIQGERIFHREILVTGRAMDGRPSGAAAEDGVRVLAEPRAGRNLTAAILTPDGNVLAQSNATSDENGDYVVALAFGALPGDARAQVTIGDEVREARFPRDTRRADIAFVVQPLGPQTPLPGEREAPTAGWLALAALTATAFAASSRGTRRRR